MTKCEFASKRFKEGFHCSQAVAEAFAKDYGIDPVLARRMATPFAGGSGLGGECGAVTGAFLVIGFKYGVSDAGDSEAQQVAFGKVREFADKFNALHGSLNCRELIGLDVFNDEELREFIQKDLKMTHCVKYVEDAVRILEESIV